MPYLEEEEGFIEVDVEDLEEETVVKEKEEEKIDPKMVEIKKLEDEVIDLIDKKKFDQLIKQILSLKKQLDETTELKIEYLNTAQRVQAEFENYKKRRDKDQERYDLINKQKILQKFLTIFEDVERTHLMFNNTPDIEQSKVAIELIYNNLKSTFSSLNIEIIDPIIEKFNPQFHEAIHSIENSNYENNTIFEVVSKGFMIDDIVMKPARVVVTKKPESLREEKS